MHNIQSTRHQMALCHGTSADSGTTIHACLDWRNLEKQWVLAKP